MKSTKGLTLIEVLVASVLLAIVVSGVMVSLRNYIQLSERNEQRYTAECLVRSRLENLNTLLNRDEILADIAAPKTASTGSESSVGNINYKIVISQTKKIKITENNSVNPELLELTAKISWGSESMSFVTYALNSEKTTAGK